MQEEGQADRCPRFQILSLDGGGLKGLFSAAYLAEWEAHTGRRVVEAMDMISGTSTGGIMALALGAGFSAQDLVDLFCEHGEAIFPTESLAAIGLVRQAIGSRYSDEPLTTVLRDRFGDRRLGDSVVRLIVPAYHVESGIHIFKTPHHPRLRMDYRERMADVAQATSAAPTFLPPMVLDCGLRLIDGGMWANNPVQIAVTEALGYLGKSKECIAALRVGTTTEALRKDEYPENPGGWGSKSLDLFIGTMMRGQSQAASGGVQQLLGSERFIEIDPLVAPSDYRLDRLSKELIGLAKSVFRHTVSELGEKRFLDHKAAPYSPCYIRTEDDSHG